MQDVPGGELVRTVETLGCDARIPCVLAYVRKPTVAVEAPMTALDVFRGNDVPDADLDDLHAGLMPQGDREVLRVREGTLEIDVPVGCADPARSGPEEDLALPRPRYLDVVQSCIVLGMESEGE